MNISQKQKIWMKALARIFFVLYLIILIYFLFFSERYGRVVGKTEYHYNLELFKEIKRFIKYRELLGIESFVVNIFGNIFAFSPFGFFLPMISSKKISFLYVILLSFEFSLSIELLQLIFKVGIFDVDDLLMNTLGVAIGYLVYWLCNKILCCNKKRIDSMNQKGQKIS